MLGLVAAGLGFAVTPPLCLWQSRHYVPDVRVVPHSSFSRHGRPYQKLSRSFFLARRENEPRHLPADMYALLRQSFERQVSPDIANALSLRQEEICLPEEGWGVVTLPESVDDEREIDEGDEHDIQFVESREDATEAFEAAEQSFHFVSMRVQFAFIEGWYNLGRRHSAIGYHAPLRYEAMHQQKMLAAGELPTAGRRRGRDRRPADRPWTTRASAQPGGNLPTQNSTA